jgi:hypothetical protein
MKRIINGRRYDTQTAKLLGVATYGYCTDFAYWREELYVKRTGEYFLYGQGGPMSKYSQQVGQNEWTGGHEIRPLSLDEAKAWAEKYLSADEYEAIFGKAEEGKVQVSTWIEEGIKAEIDSLRETKGLTIADIIKAGVLHSK